VIGRNHEKASKRLDPTPWSTVVEGNINEDSIEFDTNSCQVALPYKTFAGAKCSPFTRSIDNQWFTNQCSKSAVSERIFRPSGFSLAQQLPAREC
jgi:hypothetical protein